MLARQKEYLSGVRSAEKGEPMGVYYLKKKRSSERDTIQIPFVAWLREAYPDLITIISPIVKYHGNKWSRMRQGARIKAMGYIAGTPDLFIPIARGGYHGLFIEFKDKNGYVEEHQAMFIAKLNLSGYFSEVCRSLDEAKRVLNEYMGMPKA